MLSNLHPKLEFEAFLRTKGQAAGGTKELWTKPMVAQKNSGQSCCLQKRILGILCRQQFLPEFFCATSCFDQSSFAPPAALTRVLLCHHSMLFFTTCGSLPNTVIQNTINWSQGRFGNQASLGAERKASQVPHIDRICDFLQPDHANQAQVRAKTSKAQTLLPPQIQCSASFL